MVMDFRRRISPVLRRMTMVALIANRLEISRSIGDH
jgi:hypothetical protein